MNCSLFRQKGNFQRVNPPPRARNAIKLGKGLAASQESVQVLCTNHILLLAVKLGNFFPICSLKIKAKVTYQLPECQLAICPNFVVQCGKCRLWFHGRCVGLSKSIGKPTDNQNQEWICRPCATTSVVYQAHLSSNQLKAAVNLWKSTNDYMQYLAICRTGDLVSAILPKCFRNFYFGCVFLSQCRSEAAWLANTRRLFTGFRGLWPLVGSSLPVRLR